jgi:hypothetical protein
MECDCIRGKKFLEYSSTTYSNIKKIYRANPQIVAHRKLYRFMHSRTYYSEKGRLVSSKLTFEHCSREYQRRLQ